MRLAPISLAIVFSLLSSGCALLGIGTQAGLQLEDGEKERLKREFVGKEYVLASSVYVGEFFGDSSKLFVDARPFDIVKVYSLGVDRAPVLPANGTVIPAGTPVEITEIVYPIDGIQGALGDDGDDTQLTPSGHAWLMLEQISKTDGTTQPLVLVLPRSIPSLQDFRDSVRDRLKSPQWVISWLNTRSALAMTNIFDKRVEAGMSQSEMYAALGVPGNLEESKNTDNINWVANYGDLQITVSGKVVTDVVSLRVEAEKRRIAAMEKAKIVAEERRIAEETAKAAADKQAAEDELAAAKAEVIRQAELKKQEEKNAAIRAQAAKERKVLQAKLDKERKIREKKHAKERAERAREAAREAKNRKAESSSTASVNLDVDAAAPAAVAAAPAPAPAAKAGPVNLESDLSATAAAPAERRRAYILEARFEKLTKKSARKLGRRNTSGAFVTTVRPRGAIRELGLLANDLILEINGKRVKSPDDLQAKLTELSYGAQVTMRVWRNKVAVDLPQRGKERTQRSTGVIQLENP
jgi:hypothetical protein